MKNLSVGFRGLSILKKTEIFSLNSYKLFVYLLNWPMRKLPSISKALMSIRQIFILKLLFELFIFSYIYLALTLLLSVFTGTPRCFSLKLFEKVRIIFLFRYFVNIDVRQTLGRFSCCCFILLLLFIVYYITGILLLSPYFEKMNSVGNHSCGFRRVPNPFPSK